MAFKKLSLFTLTCAAFTAVTATPLRLRPRIAQTIVDSTAAWEKACDAAGGTEEQCNPQSQASFMTLLAAAGPCDQQDQADNMIDLAKQLNNDADMIRLTQIFVQQPRNSPNSLSVEYCGTTPKNQELAGLFQCQFKGDNPAKFTNGNAVGGAGTIPFGFTAPLNPAGACPANPTGPIADGSQLISITSDPGLNNKIGSSGSSSSGSTSSAAASAATSEAASATSSAASSASTSGTDSSDDGDTSFPTSASDSGSDDTGSATSGATATTSSSATDAASTGTTATTGFQHQNALDAQAANRKDATLTLDSPCTDGENACIDGGFAMCDHGKFVNLNCAGGTQCVQLPLVNKAGISPSCTTVADADNRFKAAGVTGGPNGSG